MIDGQLFHPPVILCLVKKSSKPFNRELSPLNLYPEDIKEIYDIMMSACLRVQVQMETDSEVFTLDSPDELKKIKTDKPYFRNFSITGYFDERQYSVMDIRFRKGRFSASEISLRGPASDDNTARGLVAKVEEFLSGKKSRIRSILFGNYFLNIFTPLFAISSLSYFLSKKVVDIMGGMIIMLSVLVLYLAAIAFVPHSILHRKDRAESSGFWERQKENISAGVIYSLLAIAILKLIEILWVVFKTKSK